MINWTTQVVFYMIEKSVAINILEDIQQCLNEEKWQVKTLSTVKQYKKGILVSIDEELKELIDEHKKYDENSTKALELSQKISERLRRIYNS